MTGEELYSKTIFSISIHGYLASAFVYAGYQGGEAYQNLLTWLMAKLSLVLTATFPDSFREPSHIEKKFYVEKGLALLYNHYIHELQCGQHR